MKTRHPLRHIQRALARVIGELTSQGIGYTGPEQTDDRPISGSGNRPCLGCRRTYQPLRQGRPGQAQLSARGVPVEAIALLAGHNQTATTELVYRHQIVPALTRGAEVMDQIFGLKITSELARLRTVGGCISMAVLASAYMCGSRRRYPERRSRERMRVR
jgi:hypothetical protein